MSQVKSSLVYVIFALTLVATLYLGYSFIKQTKVQQSNSDNDMLQTSPEFSGLKNKEEEIEWNELFERAKSNCKTEEIFFTQAERSDYLYYLSVDMLTKLDVERDINLIFKSEKVPRTSECWVIWMGNSSGEGFGGYRTTSGEIKTFSIQIPLDVLNN